MKVAICISGQARSWEQNKENIITNLFNCDHKIFVATDAPLTGITVERSVYIPEISPYPNKIAKFIQRKCPSNPTTGFLQWMYKLYKCVQLKREYELEAGQDFDVVVRVRPDCIFTNVVNLRQTNNAIVLIGNTEKDYLGGYCDQFWFSDSKTMDKISELYTKLNDYVDSGITLHPETVLKHHCVTNGISQERVDVDVNIVR